MGKVKHKLRDLSILSTFVLLAVAFLLFAMLLVEVEKTMLINAQHNIAFEYSEIVEGFNSKKVWGNQSVFLLSERDGKMMWLFEMGIWALPPLTYLTCFILAGFVFYRSKIRTPLMLLTTSARRIAENDLDFSIVYDKNDEKEKIESEIAVLIANIDDLKAQLKTKKDELKAATKDLTKAEAKKAAIEKKAAEEAKKGEAEDVLKKLLANGMTAEEILAKLQ